MPMAATATAAAGLLALSFEIAQLLIRSRVTTARDVIDGWVGGFIGASLAWMWMRRQPRVNAWKVVAIAYGLVLAIAALKAGASSAIGTDIDLDSVLVANENARKNQVNGFTALHVTGANTPRIRQGGPYDTVFANILMRPLIGLAPDIAALTAPGGTIILSGLLHHQAPPVRNAFASRGLDFQGRIREDGWSTLVFRKPG